jgi:glycine cleavage system H protein
MTTRYTKDHEYIRVDGDTGTVGITAYAQEQLGDIVYVELPETGRKLQQGDEAAVVESVKAASEIYAPVSGTVTEVNQALAGEPGLINASPDADGWIYRIAIADAAELDGLLDAEAYAAHTA